MDHRGPEPLTWVNPPLADSPYALAMLIGVPREIKVHEYRVGLTPESVRELVEAGHRVLVEHDAGHEIVGIAWLEHADDLHVAARPVLRLNCRQMA